MSFLREKLGIRSVATTHTTDALTARTLNNDPGSRGGTAHPMFNPDVGAMTTEALHLALDDHTRTSGRRGARPGSLAGHIHISWSGDDRLMFALAEARLDTGWHTPGLTSLHVLSGCAGLFEALNYAQYLLHQTRARDDEDALVFVTVSNDLYGIARTRTRTLFPVPQDGGLDHWLFPAIFGEGAGALILGHTDRQGGDWAIEDFGAGPVTEDWRVTMPPRRQPPPHGHQSTPRRRHLPHPHPPDAYDSIVCALIGRRLRRHPGVVLADHRPDRVGGDIEDDPKPPAAPGIPPAALELRRGHAPAGKHHLHRPYRFAYVFLFTLPSAPSVGWCATRRATPCRNMARLRL
ncbi:hypothetical protein ACFXP3_13600 [Streptomyces sp. NPDC059096]|uniref:hypothetical protein n=1 Tax=Streptomyces sp. NPDC059096 TaxID=3346727 RepID=UPI0036CD9302